MNTEQLRVTEYLDRPHSHSRVLTRTKRSVEYFLRKIEGLLGLLCDDDWRPCEIIQIEVSAELRLTRQIFSASEVLRLHPPFSAVRQMVCCVVIRPSVYYQASLSSGLVTIILCPYLCLVNLNNALWLHPLH